MEYEQNGWAWPRLPIQAWGPKGWSWLHGVAIGYPAEPTSANARATYDRILRFLTQLPCADCRAHALRYFIHTPPDLTSSLALQSWAWGFHNAVNQRLGKPAFAYAAYQRQYADDISWAALPLRRARRTPPLRRARRAA
jgi:hypothetical protein